MIYRWDGSQQWDLVREVTVFDPLNTRADQLERLMRGERDGIHWVLPSQYHLDKIAAKEILE